MSKAREFLSDVRPEEAFHVYNGTYVRNLHELLDKLEAMDDAAFNLHVNSGQDDFAPWIENCIGDKTLAFALYGVTERKAYASIIRRRIRRLELLEKLIRSSLFLGSQVKHKTRNYGPLITIIIVVLMLSQIGYLTKLYQETELQLRTVDQRLTNFVTKQITADNVLFMHLVGIEDLLNLSINKTTFELEENFSMSPFIFPKPLPPQDRVREGDILVSNRSVVLFIDSPQWARISDTKSMEPVLSSGSHAISVRPYSPEVIQVGDIVSFLDAFNDTVIHRVMEIGYDEVGWYAVTKGDANLYEDPFKVRFSQVKRVLVAIVY